MNTSINKESLSKARAGVFVLLIAISLYSLFMISASNSSYAAGKGLFKFSSLIGLSPNANGYDRQNFKSKLAENLISAVDNISIDVPNFGGASAAGGGIASFDQVEIADFLSSPRKSKFRRLVAGAAGGNAGNGNGNGIVPSNLLLAFSGTNGGINGGLVSECITSLSLNPDTEEYIVEEVIACILNGNDSNLLADNGTDPFGNGGNGIDDPDANNGNGANGAGDPSGNGGGGANGNGAGNSGNGAGGSADNGNGTDGAGDPSGTGGTNTATVIAEVPEPSTYMLLGLGILSMVGFSRRKVRIEK